LSGFIIDELSRYIIAKRAVEKTVTKEFMVAAKHPLAALAGVEILKKGGNAVDAAVATHFALAVVEPFMTGIGGGGRCVIRLRDGDTFILNFEPMTPKKDAPFEPDPKREAMAYGVPLGRPAVKYDADKYGYKAAGVPGFVKGMSYLVDRFGSMELGELLEPAIKYAEEGFLLDTYIAKAIAFEMFLIAKFPETAKTLLKDGIAPKPWGWYFGDFDRLIQKDLAATLRRIADDGVDAFYKGEVAHAIAEDMVENGGYITEDDLAHYEPEILEPGKGSYRGHDLIHFPISTGIIQILNILEGFDMKEIGYNTGKSTHLLIEAIKLAFASRAKFLGTGLEKRPFSGIVSKEYAKSLRKTMDMDEAQKGLDLGDPWLYQEENTTHACVIDKERNIVGMHTSLGNTFGSKVTVKGTGIILNSKMSGYDPRQGMPHSVKPRTIKPPPSGSTIMLKDDEPFLVIGAPGGYKQVTAVARVIHNIIDYGMSLQEAIDTPRVYVQTGRVFIESKTPTGVCQILAKMGHNLIVIDKEYNFAQPTGILIDTETGLLHGGVDRDLPHGLDAITLGQ
jgi:gamma-glutamyltranspeptidase/glutathione hydrolase